jgi:multidrug resistance protein
MATPATLPASAWEARDPSNEKAQEAYQQGHDADMPTDNFSHDAEKGARSQAYLTNTEQDNAHTSPEQDDPNIVGWDGPDDPQNPLNWAPKKKWSIIAALGAITLISPLASSFFAPGVPQVMRAFDEQSNLIATFVVSIYLLGFAIGPLIIAPMSEIYGRMPIYNICNVLFIIFNVGCALSTSMGMLIAFRFLAGCAGASPLTLGGGTIADMFPPEQRAGAMAIYSLGPLLGPILGPVAGGFLVASVSWRWVFWILAMAGGFFGIIMYFVAQETYHAVIMDRKVARLRKETGNMDLRSKLDSGLTPKQFFIRAVARPMKMLFFSPIVGLMSLYISVNYGILYLFFTTMTFVFEGQYGFSSGSVGLSYLGMGVGMIFGMGVLGTMSDKNIKKHQAKGNAKPEHRLPLFLTIPGAILMPVGIFLYGWTTYYGVHWIVPIIGKSKPSQPSSYPLHVAYILTYLPKAPAASASAISRP